MQSNSSPWANIYRTNCISKCPISPNGKDISTPHHVYFRLLATNSQATIPGNTPEMREAHDRQVLSVCSRRERPQKACFALGDVLPGSRRHATGKDTRVAYGKRTDALTAWFCGVVVILMFAVGFPSVPRYRPILTPMLVSFIKRQAMGQEDFVTVEAWYIYLFTLSTLSLSLPYV